MSVFEITIQRKDDDAWPVVVRHQPGAQALARWSRGRLDLDLACLKLMRSTDKEYGALLGQALFREEIRDAFVRAVTEARDGDEPLRVLLIVEADDLRDLHWEQLCAPLDRGWDYLLLNQGTPFSLYLPSQIERRFPPIGRRDLRALVLVASPEELDGDYQLAPFDAAATVRGIQHALGEIPCDVLATAEAAIGPPTLNALCEHLTAGSYTLLHLVCHGAYLQDSGETILYIPKDENGRPVPATTLIERLGRLRRLPHLTFLSTCESADPRAEAGLGGLGQRLVRELGMPAAVAMTDRISVDTAGALASAFYARLRESGEVDCALSAALVGLQGRHDVTVPALFSRLGGRTLWTDALDRPLTEAEIGYGLEQMGALLDEQAPVLKPEFEDLAATLRASLDTDPAALSAEARRERQAALAAANQLCSEALDLSFNALALGQPPPDYDGRCPFPGLLAFGARYAASGQKEEDDRAFFFGRKALVDKLVGRLMEHGFLAVLGPSGCGKSSLVLAGLVPTLQEGDPPHRMAYLTPGSEPLAQLEAALAAASSGDGGPNLIVVDQFEELFTLCRHESKRQVFVNRLLVLSASTALVLTMRADFWGECAAYPALKEEMQAHQELVAPMDAAALRRAMERQADHVGLRFEAGLGEAILDDVEGEPGAMPLLQHALLLLWQRRHGRWLRWEEYRAIGGIRQAIAHTADEVYLGLAGQEQARMRDIFLRLTSLEEAPAGAEARDTRRRVGLAELVPAGREPTDTEALVKRLADARLMVTSLNAASGQDEVEVAHEALIRHWPRLRGWLNEDRAELHLREGVREAALEWEANGQEEAYLVHRGGRLEDAEALHRQPRFALNELEQAYVEACGRLRERERREKEAQQRRELEAARKLAEEQAASATRIRRRAVVIGAVGIVALVLAVLSTLFWLRAQDSAADANAASTRAVANEAEANNQKGTAEANAVEAEANLRTANVRGTEAVAARQTAEAHAEEAQRQAHIAQARELAALASGQLDEDLDLALLLGVEAYRQEDLLQTRQVLFQAWSHTPELSRFLHGQAGDVTSVAWWKDERLACGSGDGTITVWDLTQASVGHGLPAQTLEGHSGWVTSVAWSPEGQLASGSVDGTIIVWDLERGLLAQTLEGHSDRVNSVAWSADGQLASGSWDTTIIVWDLERGLPHQTLEGHSSAVYSVAWSADGRLASGAADLTVIVWNLDTGQPAKTLWGHSMAVMSVAWSADGRLASGESVLEVIVWNLEEDRPAQTLVGHSGSVTSVAWSPDGRLASGSSDGTVIIWDLERGQPGQTLEGQGYAVNSVAWSADGQLASGSHDSTIFVWGLEEGRPPQVLERQSDWVFGVAWSADGRLASSSGGTVTVWDLAESRAIQTLPGHYGRIRSTAWSTDGRLASGSGDGTVIVWDLEESRAGQTLSEHSSRVTSVAWSADGRLASGSDDGTVIVWDLEETRAAQTLPGLSGGVASVAWSTDGRLAASGCESQDSSQVCQRAKIIVWDLSKAGLEHDLEPQTLEVHPSWLSPVAWSADGRLASGSDNTVMVWDLSKTGLERGLPPQTLEGHSTTVNSVAWSADGLLASGSYDGTVIVWDLSKEGLERGLPAYTLGGHSHQVMSVAWSADGWLASGSYDRTVQVWIMDPAEWIRQACDRAGRNLTGAEWALYLAGEEYRRTCAEWPEGQ